ncbi:unnamed protein product [Coregonus sp. 'balchen']|nr:unnamed protein product [Coregonus sp. 'balchen']
MVSRDSVTPNKEEYTPTEVYSSSAETIVTAEPPYLRLSVNVDKMAERVDLKISSAEVTDSALYYCALRPTVTGNPEAGDTLEDDITPTSPEEYYLEVKAGSLLWYRQYSGSGLQFLYLVTTTNNPYDVRGDPQYFRLSVTLNKERTCVDLETSSAEVTYSALYYCALRTTVTGNPETQKKPDNIYSCLGNSFGDSINPATTKELVQEGRNVHLSCKHDGTVYNLQSYRQYPRSKPEFLLYITSEGYIFKATPPHPRLTVTIDKVDKRVDLKISSAEVTDSALYYCAMAPTVRGNPDTLYKNLSRHVLEGTTVTLSYNCSSSSTIGKRFYWDHQTSAGKMPTFLLWMIDTDLQENWSPAILLGYIDTETKRADLNNSSAEVTYSALY